MNTSLLFSLRRVSFITILLSLLCILPVQAAFYSDNSGSKSSFLEDTDADKFLPPDQAFKLTVTARDRQTLEASFIVAPGHYLYRERIKFEIKAPAGGGFTKVELPKGELKQDPTFGQTEVYYHDVAAKLALSGVTQGSVTIAATYQGCSEKGLCYAPIHKTLVVDLGEANAKTATSENSNSGDDQATSLLKNGKLWLIVVSFFGFGLLLSLTPCVLPMIPILSSIIVGSKQKGRLYSFNLSLAYTLGMALSYTLIGIAAGLSGQLLSIALQNVWALSATALVFVLLALSMFGFYELRLPSQFENRVMNASNRFKGGQLLGVFAMGALSALIMSPCVAAPLAGALLYISQTHDIALGGTALFALSLGMGVPLLVIGASAGTLLPKAGPWMNAVRNFFGVVMLGVALWLVSPILPISIVMALCAALLIIPAVYLNAIDGLPVTAHRWRKFWKGVGVIMLIIGIALLLGALSGSKSPLQPLAALGNVNVQQTPASRLPFTRVGNLQELENSIKAATGKTVMLDFYADWCVACKEYERYTFSDARVQKHLENVVLLQADVTENSAADMALLKRFDLFGPPGILFFDVSGQETARVIGYKDANQFLKILSKLEP